MPNHRGHDGAKTRRALFAPEDRAKILQLVVGKPSGTVITVGGIEFDLVPFTTADGLDLFDLADKIGEMWGKFKSANLEEAEVGRFIKTEGSRILRLLRLVLHESAFIENDEQEALFNEWFDKLPLLETTRAIAPALMRANGIKALQGNASRPTAVPDPSQTESPST